MRHLAIAVFAAVLLSTTASAEKIDPRLASARKAFIEPEDELGDDVVVAACMADRLKDVTPMESVKSKGEADVVLTVKAHITSGASRVLLGSMGGTPSANVEASLPDGTKLWSDGAKYRKGNGAIGVAAASPGCGLANNLLNTLREAMRKARDGQ